MPNRLLSPGKIACLATICFVALTAISIAQTPTNDGWENQQRAIRLIQFDKEISSIPEQELRLPLRYSILEFIYTKEVRSQYAAAGPILTAYFEDAKLPGKDAVYRPSHYLNRMALLLRKHDPETAKLVEAKYSIVVDTGMDDYSLLSATGADRADLNSIVDRTIERLRTMEDAGELMNIYEGVRRRSPEHGMRLLLTALEVAEKNPTPNNASMLSGMMVDVLNDPPPAVTADQMLRYYRVLVTAARAELSKAHPKNYYTRTEWPLRRALPKIEKVDARLYAEGRAIFANYRRSMSKDQLAREEADDRIEAAENQLERAIAEAESSSVEANRDYLWSRAAQKASGKYGAGNNKMAADLLMKAGPTLGSGKSDYRDERLANLANWAQSKDRDGAKYAIDLIKDDHIRTRALLRFINSSRLWIDDKLTVAKLADEVIRQIEKIGPTYSTVCDIGNSRYVMTAATSFTNIQQMTARTVGIINMYSSEGADARAGSLEREKFVTAIRSVSGCAAYIFRPVTYSPATSKIPTPDPELAKGIKIKEIRLIAQIEAEKHRRYPVGQ